MTSISVNSQLGGDTGKYNGIAPDADLVIVKAFDSHGCGTYADVIQGIEWIVANRDAYGIRATADPFTFLAWFFMIDGLAGMWPYALYRVAKSGDWPEPGPLIGRGLAGAFIAYASFGGIMLATRLDKVGEAAVLRETSTVFAALIGWLLLKETIGPRRLALMGLIAAGAVLVELGG